MQQLPGVLLTPKHVIWLLIKLKFGYLERLWCINLCHQFEVVNFSKNIEKNYDWTFQIMFQCLPEQLRLSPVGISC